MQAEIIENGITSQTSSLYDHDTWTITNFTHLDTQGFVWMYVIIIKESKNTANIITGCKETGTDISLPLHKQ